MISPLQASETFDGSSVASSARYLQFKTCFEATYPVEFAFCLFEQAVTNKPVAAKASAPVTNRLNFIILLLMLYII